MMILELAHSHFSAQHQPELSGFYADLQWSKSAAASLPPGLDNPAGDTANIIRAANPSALDWADEAANMVGQLQLAGQLSPPRLALSREVIGLLKLWRAPAPTEIGDSADGDFTLVWRLGKLVASLTIAEDDVLGYAFKPSMNNPWMLEQERISLVELNSLARILGEGTCQKIG